MDVNRPTLERRPARSGAWPNADRISLQVLLELRLGAGRDFHTKELAVQPVHMATVGPAEARRIFDKGLQYRLKVKGRAADHLQDFAGGGLLLQSLAHLRMRLG